MERHVSSFACLAFLLLLSSPRVGALQVDPANNRLIDEYGRERYFHGVNVVYKSPPYLPVIDHFDPNLSLSEEDFKFLRSIGMNGIRLGTMWPGGEPERGQYNATYIEQLAKIVEMGEQYGVYFLLDAHQDCFALKFCGEGVPDWAAEAVDASSFPMPFGPAFNSSKEGTMPTPEECSQHSWIDYQLTLAGSSAYQNLYKNKDGVADHFGGFWQKVADAFKNSSAVIGYELLNEPFAGNVYEDPLLFIPELADEWNLLPFYDGLFAAIREVDTSTPIYFESVTWADVGTGFKRAPAQNNGQAGLSFHYYNPPNTKQKEAYFEGRLSDAKRLGVGAFLTEFDISNDGEGTSTYDNINSVIELCEKYALSWLGWEYKGYAGTVKGGTCTGCGNGPWHPNGTINHSVAKVLSRPYAVAVAGTQISGSYDEENNSFALAFAVSHAAVTAGANAEAKTSIIYANEEYYFKAGANIAVSPPSAASIDGSDAPYYRVVLNADSVKEGDVVAVTVTNSA